MQFVKALCAYLFSGVGMRTLGPIRLRKGVDYVVMHKNLAAEVAHSEPRSTIDMSHWIEDYRTRYGSPEYEDSSVIVFGLDVGQ